MIVIYKLNLFFKQICDNILSNIIILYIDFTKIKNIQTDPPFLNTSILVGGERSVSRADHFVPGKAGVDFFLRHCTQTSSEAQKFLFKSFMGPVPRG
jgi:hypothetical protein